MKHRSSNRYLFDFDAFLRTIILLGFMGLIMWLIRTQQLTLYINPRFSGLVELASYILFLMFVTHLLTIFRPAYAFSDHHCHGSRFLLYLPFLFVLILAFALPDNTLSSNLVNAKGLNNQAQTPALTASYEMSRPLAPALRQMTVIDVSDHDYTEIMNELQFFSQDYIGKDITMTGFVFKPPEASSSQFSLVRYVIVCCTADALPYGVLCELKDAANYKEGTWLTIRGVIQNTTYDDQTVPVIKITSLKQVQKPKNPYVFPLDQ